MKDRPAVLASIFLILFGPIFNHCAFMGASMPFITATIASFPSGFLTQSIIALMMVLPASERYSTADGIQGGYHNG